MKFKNILFLTTLFSLIAIGCKKDVVNNDPLIDNIPADASAVTAINVGSLYEKVGFEWLSSLDFYKDIIEKSEDKNPYLAEVLRDPEKTGIDLTGTAYVVQGGDIGNSGFTGVMLPVQNSKALEKFMDQMDAPIARDANYQYISEVGTSFMAWNDEMIVIGTSDDRDFAKSKALEILEGPKEKLEGQPNFQKFSKDDHDFSTWISTKELKKMTGVGSMIEDTGITLDMLDDNYIHTAFDFNEDSFEGSFDLILHNDLKRELKILLRDKPKYPIAADFPKENRLMTYSTSFNPKGAYQLMSERSVFLGPVNKELKEYGLNTKDLSKAFTGDMAMSMYRVAGIDEPVPVVGLATSDAPEFKKIWDTAIENDFLDMGEKENIYTLPPKYSKRGKYVKKTEKGLFFSPSVEALDLVGTRTGTIDATHDHMSGLSIDVEGMAHFLNADINPNFTRLEAYSDLEKGKMTMDVKDGDLNSLQTMLDFVNKLHLKQQKKFNSNSEETSKSL